MLSEDARSCSCFRILWSRKSTITTRHVKKHTRNNTLISSSLAKTNETIVNSYWSILPSEMQAAIFEHCDALTCFINWNHTHLASNTAAPTATAIWIAALQMDWPQSLSKLPLIERPVNTSLRISSLDDTTPASKTMKKSRTKTDEKVEGTLPDVAILCKFTQSREMLWRLYATGLDVPDDLQFTRFNASPRNLVHVAMRHCWHDICDEMVRAGLVSDGEKATYAMAGSHYDYWQFLTSRDYDLRYQYDEFFDLAARNGEVGVLRRLPGIRGTYRAMDYAASRGHLEVLKYLNTYRTEGCSLKALEKAAMNGHLETVQWLIENQKEGRVRYALDAAAEHGHLEIIKWLVENRFEGISTMTMDLAAMNGHLKVVQWLHLNRTEGCSKNALNHAARNGHFDVVQFLVQHRSEGSVNDALDNAVLNGHDSIVKYLKKALSVL